MGGEELATPGGEENRGEAKRSAYSVVDLQREVTRCASSSELFAVLAAGLGKILPVADRVSIVFLESNKEWMRIYRVLPAVGNLSEPLPRVRVEGTPVGRVVRDGVGRVVADVREDPNITFGHASHDRIRSTLSAPIRLGGLVVGAINAGSSIVGGCTNSMLRQLEDIVAVLGPTIFASEQLFGADGKEPGRVGRISKRYAVGASEGLVGESAPFKSLMAAARRAALSDEDILITGETGVGKTALARAIHAWSDRADGPFATVHIADLAPTIVESELFGHVRGAFTGATADRVGRFEGAQGGTAFLDEIGETPSPMQSKLLRVIQDRCFERVGGSKTIEADVRIIAATSRDLRESMMRGEFREDLFYRLNVIPLHVPALRERADDLEILVSSLLERLGKGRSHHLSEDAWRKVRNYAWPGNIRELECVLRRAVILEDGDALQLAGFPERDMEAATPADENEWVTLDEHQRRYIEKTLERCEGVIEGPTGAAKRLGMRPSTLRSRMERLGICSWTTRKKGRR